MRVTIPHGKSRQEAIRIVDESFNDLFKGLPIPLLEITDPHRSWNGFVMTFGLTARLAFLQNPIRGTVEVTEREITVDADLGFLERLISPGAFKTTVQGNFQKLLPR